MNSSDVRDRLLRAAAEIAAARANGEADIEDQLVRAENLVLVALAILEGRL
jgi:hypothetical protein